ncbi:MAG: FixH family protein [Planctomycetota bacterium]
MSTCIKKLLTALFALLGAACSGTGGETQGLTARLAFDPQPHVGWVECTVALLNADGTPAQCSEIELEGNMNHAGMVPEFASAEPRGEGVFVAQLEFTMGGDWLIFVRGKSEAGQAFEIVTDVPGVRAQARAAEVAQNTGK